MPIKNPHIMRGFLTGFVIMSALVAHTSVIMLRYPVLKSSPQRSTYACMFCVYIEYAPLTDGSYTLV